MITLVRHTPIIRKIGQTVEVFKGKQPAQIGEVGEITDPEGNVLNIAKVVDIYDKDGDQYMTLRMIA
jgi:RNase P/RNase MRP subunit p29